MLDYYSLLNVSSSSSYEEIRKSYKDLIKKWHPDTFSGDTTLAELMTRQLNEAYETLSNEESRKKYDQNIRISVAQTVAQQNGYQGTRRTRQYTPKKNVRSVKPSYPNTEDDIKREIKRKEVERIDRWMTEISRYMSEHMWADKKFEELSEETKLKAMGGNLSYEEAFKIYCMLQKEKIRMGLKTPYFNEKIIEKHESDSKNSEEIEIALEEISRKEIILQIYLRIKSGIFSTWKLSEEETDIIVKFGKFQEFLVKRPDEFFIGVNRFSLSLQEWKIAKELSKMGVKDAVKD